MSSISLTLSLRGRLLGGYQTTLQGALFGNNEPGFTFEPWDMTTLYQDRAGTTPVTAAGQSVGLRLDKSQGLRQGPERGAALTLAGWTVTSGVAVSGGVATFSSAAQNSNAYNVVGTVEAGKTYRVSLTVSSYVSGTAALLLPGGSGRGAITSNGTFTGVYTAGSTGVIYLWAQGASNNTFVISNYSVRELAGNHEVAINDAARGVYGREPESGTRNLLTLGGTTLLNNSDGGATIDNAPTGFTPPIDASFQRVTKLAVATQFYAYRTSQVGASTGQTVMSYYVLPDAGCTEIGFHTDTNAQGRMRYNLTTGVTTLGTNTAAAGAVALGGGWYRIWTKTMGVVASMIWTVVANTATTGAAASFVVGGHQSEAASLTAFQKTVSQYDITEAGVPSCYYVQTDGVDDAYVTPTLTPGTDKVQVFAGVRKNSDATSAVFLEFSTVFSSNNGTFALWSPLNSGAISYAIQSRGTATGTGGTGATYLAPITKVLTGIGDISGDTASIRVNGATIATGVADQGTGNYLAYPAYIYARGGTTLPFNGRDYGHAVRFGPNLDAATIARVEALIARNTPTVTL